MSAHSPPVSPPPQFTIVPPTPQNPTFITRFIEVVPGLPSTMTLPLQPQRRRPPSTPPGTIITSANSAQDIHVVSPVRSNSVRSPLSRRIRHNSVRVSPPQTRSQRDDQLARSPSTSIRSSERSTHPQLPQISTVSPILVPSPRLTPPSPVPLLTEGAGTSDTVEKQHTPTKLAARGRIPDFARVSQPSSGSTSVKNKDGILGGQLMDELEDMLENQLQDQADTTSIGQQALAGPTKTNATPSPDKSRQRDRTSDPELPQREPSVPSRKPPSLSPSPIPSHKSGSHHSQRSVSEPLPTAAKISRPAVERHPNQLFAMQSSKPQRDSSSSTPKLSYASLNLDATQFMNAQTPVVSTILRPSIDFSIVDVPENFPTRPYHETPTTSLLRNHSSPGGGGKSPSRIHLSGAAHHAHVVEDPDGSRITLSSVTGSPRRSIPKHESPPPQNGPSVGSERTTTPVGPRMEEKQHTLRRKRGSIMNSQQNVHDLPSNVAIPQPLVVYIGDPMTETASYTNPLDQTMSDSITSQPAQAMLIANPPPIRTLDSVRNQVASEIAFRSIAKSNVVDGVRVGVADASSAWAGPNDISFIHRISSALSSSFPLSSIPYLFIITATSFSSPSSNGSSPGILYITSSSREITSRAVHLTSSKFIGRVTSSSYTFSTPNIDSEKSGDISLGLATEEKEWMCRIKELHFSSFDSDIIYSILLTASRTPLDPTKPPPNSKSINIMLEEARAKLTRVSPRQAFTELKSGLGTMGMMVGVPTVLVDIRPQGQREEYGEIPGALVVERNVLEWKFDPRCEETRLDVADRYDLRVIVFCQDGSTSSLAALSLQNLGLLNATDLIGGFKAWKEARLPVEPKPQLDRSIVSAAGSLV